MRVAYSEVPKKLDTCPDARRVAVSPRLPTPFPVGIPMPQHIRSRLAIVASLLAFGAIVAAVFMCWVPVRARVALDIEGASEVSGSALMFKQCGGKSWTGPNCCEPGCACVMHTKFYSQCVPPRGMAECSSVEAVHEVSRAQRKKDFWLPLKATRAKTAKLAAENVTSVMDALAEARMARDKAGRQGEVLIAKDEKAQKEQDRTKKEAEKAAAFRAKKVAANKTLAKEVGEILRDNALRQNGKCAGMFGQCGGANFNGGGCCQKGCRCVFKDNYYSQCEAHKDDGFCNVMLVESQEQALFSKAKKIRREAESAVHLHIAAHKAAASAKERATHAAKAAKPARIALAKAEKKFALKKQAANVASTLAANSKAAAQRADLQSAIWSVAVIAWGKAKDKNACRWPGSAHGEVASDDQSLAKDEGEEASSESGDGQEATIVDSEDMSNTAGEEGSTSAKSDAGAEASALASASNGIEAEANAGLRFLMKRLMGEPPKPPKRAE